MKKKLDLMNIEPVELKPILGIRPGIVILIALALLILLALFILLVLPGLASKSSYVSFSFNARNVAIYDGDRYLGSSEGSVYKVKSGSHSFSFKLNGIAAGSIEYNVKKHIFFTLFHRSIENIDITIENNNEIEKGERNYFARGIAVSSRVIDYSSSYHFEPYYSQLAYNAVNLGFDSIKDVWLYGALHITSDVMYSDYKQALEILSSSDIDYSSSELDKLNSYLERIYSSDKDETLSFDSTTALVSPTDNGDYSKYPSISTSIGRSVKLSYPDVNEAGQYVDVDGFNIENEVVSEYMYALFVEENPYWGKANKENLIKDNMVDDSYLNGIMLSTSIKSSRPIRNVSYYAAKSYTEWLSARTGKAYSLPTEAEWIIAGKSSENKEFAKSLISIEKDSTTPMNMLGQLWELTSTSYIPLSRLIDRESVDYLEKMFDYDDIIIKGGSYINANDNITIDTVGVVDRSICSDYIGFRVVFHE